MALQKTNISFASSGQFSRLFMDYVSAEKSLQPFYTYSPQIASFEKAMADRKDLPVNRQLLADVLQEQYKNVSETGPQQAALKKLLQSNTFTVCTGHQLCLFTGPLYFIYKILTTINLAEALKKAYPANDFVPVYWMASEDHDIEEIRHIHLFGKKISWEDTEAKGPAGRVKTTSLKMLLEELKPLFGDSENAAALLKLFSETYLNNKDLASATRHLVHELFGKYGLLILDGDDVRLKSEFGDVMRDDISKHTNHPLVAKTAMELKQKGYDVQVNPREINVFRMEGHERVRIESTNEEVLKLSFEKYSPNVVLRPLYQQRILPNLAYVGGPGEIAYWLEYKTMFDHHKILFPVLIPRNFALLTDERTSVQLKKFGLKQEDVFAGTDELIKRLLNQNAVNAISLDAEAQELKTVFAVLATKTSMIDPTLKASVEAELQKVLNSLKNIETKLLRAEKQKQETSINQLKKIKEKFIPSGVLQERYENFSPYYLKHGKQFIDDLKEAFDPFEFKLLILESIDNTAK